MLCARYCSNWHKWLTESCFMELTFWMDAENSKQTGKNIAGQVMTRAVASVIPSQWKFLSFCFSDWPFHCFYFFYFLAACTLLLFQLKLPNGLVFGPLLFSWKLVVVFQGRVRASEDTPNETLRILGFSATCNNVDDVRDLLHLDILPNQGHKSTASFPISNATFCS